MAKKAMPATLKKKIAKSSTGGGKKTAHLAKYQFTKSGGKGK